MVWIGLIWLMIGTSGGLLGTRQWTSGFHKMLASSWVAAQLTASQEELSSMSEWVMNPLDIWLDFVDAGSAHRKASVCTQHKHSCPEWDWSSRSYTLIGRTHYVLQTVWIIRWSSRVQTNNSRTEVQLGERLFRNAFDKMASPSLPHLLDGTM
jgi:hypothetical protein